jgi:hypothetical protein
VCLEGFCVQSCLLDEECPVGTSCTSNLCLPDLSTTTGDDVTDTLDVTSSTTLPGGDETTDGGGEVTTDVTDGMQTTGAT